MLVSVSERRDEVGLLKALGADRRQILLIFLIEAALLSAIGGLLGLAMAALERIDHHLLDAEIGAGGLALGDIEHDLGRVGRERHHIELHRACPQWFHQGRSEKARRSSSWVQAERCCWDT